MSVKIPIIGITTYGRNKEGDYYLPAKYVDGVRQAGGLPILLAPGEKNVVEVFSLVDGILFAGGGDLAPTIYGGKPHPRIARVDAERDRFEMSLARLALASDKPVLGICRGFQLLNIVTGGDLLQHVPDKYDGAVLHRQENGDQTEHEVNLMAGSRLAEIIGATRINVVSMHHQALDRIAHGWQVVAHADDGLVEAIEHTNHPWMVAVLWHPELALDDPNHQRVFAAFVKALRADQRP